jgi:hypothetical protein
LPENFLPFKYLPETVKQALGCARFGLCTPVKDARAFTSVQHQPTILEIGQVSRYIRLGHLKNVTDIASAQLSVQQQVEHSQASYAG